MSRRFFSSTSATFKALIWTNSNTTVPVAWVKSMTEKYLDFVAQSHPHLGGEVDRLAYARLK